jgi:hypothetical protein
MKAAILSYHCLMRFDHRQIVVTCTNFSSCGFGYLFYQPKSNCKSEEAMHAYRAGSNFLFMTKESSAILHPVACGGQQCHGNKVCLHLHLGEGFAGEWAINKN